MALEAKTGNAHFHEALPKLVNPFWGKPKVAALLYSMVRRVQELEDVCWEVLDAYDPTKAEGHPLAVIGKIVGQQNLGWSDDEYRRVIFGKVRANRSQGLISDLVEVIQQVSGAVEVDVRVYPFCTTTVAPLAVLPDFEIEALLYLLPKTRPIATQMHVFFAPEGVGDFDFESDGVDFDDVTDPGSIDPGPFDVRKL